MSITREQAEHVAHLARLTLTPAELDRLGAELSQILEYMGQLAELDVAHLDAPPSATPLDPLDEPPRADASLTAASGALREDTPQPGLSREQALAEAPRAVSGSFAVPRFVEEP
ncbi:MAG: Asp-tRNA(Asn)/Glu-tRNA(Gln) amidotransferase subunit GatC [Polyangiaceae bacterium]|nr:Asp-tRNA(Asn)/Glu-tRNA(Gln) amidotransferase subunit GatC [Polyangiaceae bacterium]MCW5791014.1 Asp-tRNA(Asn)/Glu-tRNA(Gln) amidotransferase subunit GatC [Polyangiaceae bacterium]